MTGEYNGSALRRKIAGIQDRSELRRELARIEECKKHWIEAGVFNPAKFYVDAAEDVKARLNNSIMSEVEI